MKYIKRNARIWLVGVCTSAVLAACGGGGTSGGGTSTGTGAPAYTLFATDATHGVIAAFTTADPTPGQQLSANVVESSEGGQGIVYDAGHNELYAVRTPSGSATNVVVDVFANASHMSAGAAPARSIIIAGYVPAVTSAIALDTATDQLWIGGIVTGTSNTGGRVTVFAHASGLNGNATPTRDIQGLPDFLTFALDTVHDMLYLAGGGGITHGVYAFANASTLSTGGQAPRIIGGVDGTGSFLISVDAQRDMLYVPSVAHDIGVVYGASTASPTVAAMVFPSDPSCCVSATIDSRNNRLYVGSYGNAYVLDNASTLVGTAVASGASVIQSDASIFAFAFP